MTGKLKIFSKFVLKVFAAILAIVCCLPFMMFEKIKCNKAFAENEIQNTSPLKINTALNVNRETNRSLVKKGTDEFFDGYIYSVKADSDAGYLTMNFSVDVVDFNDSKSLYLWVFLPSLTMPDIVVVANDSSNASSLSWRLKGYETADNENFEFSLENMVVAFHGQVSKGWKLLELSFDEASMSGESFDQINSLYVSTSFVKLSESDEYDDFSVTYPFVADEFADKTSIVDYQGYVVYAEKQSFLDLRSSIFVGDDIEIVSEKDFFVYVIVGKQNVLDNKTGFSWNIKLNEPSGRVKNLVLDRKLTIEFENKGYYSLDVNLLTSNQDVYPLISENYVLYVDEFVFGYFAKKEFSFDIGSTNAFIMTLSSYFELGDVESLKVDVSDKNIASVTYYVENNKVYFKVNALKKGVVNLKISADGIKLNEEQSQTYETNLKIIVEKPQENTDFRLLGIIFGLFVAGFVIYIVILFVKARRFSVK